MAHDHSSLGSESQGHIGQSNGLQCPIKVDAIDAAELGPFKK